MGLVTATAAHDTSRDLIAQIRTFHALLRSGFRRYATYRQATVAGAATNTVFGFLRCYALQAAVTGAGGIAAGYDLAQVASYVWLGQGLLAVVMFWGWSDLADRVRTGEVATDLLRPIHPVTFYLATDLGRAGHALLFRFVPPMVVGGIAFDLYLPGRPGTWLLFAGSVVLATVIGFSCRYLVNAAAYWLLDARGVSTAWAVGGAALAGLYFPLHFLPGWLTVTLYLATPFPGMLQIPADVFIERDPPVAQAGLVGLQAAWAVAMVLACRAVQARAERRLVIQGG